MLQGDSMPAAAAPGLGASHSLWCPTASLPLVPHCLTPSGAPLPHCPGSCLHCTQPHYPLPGFANSYLWNLPYFSGLASAYLVDTPKT